MEDYKIPLTTINEAPYNPRKISTEALEKLKSSIWSHSETIANWHRSQGYRLVDPIIVNQINKRLIGGHQRVKALKEFGQDWIHAEDIRWLSIEDERKEAALNIALNNQDMAGGWDFPKLKDIVVEIDNGDFDIYEFTGFDQDSLNEMFAYLKEDESEAGQGEKEVNENTETKNECPKCGYQWIKGKNEIEIDVPEKQTREGRTVS